MAARLKWMLWQANFENNKYLPTHSLHIGGEGNIDEQKIKEKIFSIIREKKLPLPLAIKTYYTRQSPNLDTSIRGGKPVFTPGHPIKEEFEWAISEELKIIHLKD